MVHDNPSNDGLESAWPATAAEKTFDDPLLHCLAWLSRYWNNPHSESALRAGLPLTEALLTPDLFIRAANSAGFAARLVRRPLRKISALVLPAVLLLQDRQACLLMAIDQDQVSVVLPETGGGATRIAYAELEQRYIGSALFLRPRFHFDTRSAEIPALRPASWFWGTLRLSLPLHVEVGLASIFINIFALASPLFVMNVYDRVVPNNSMETLWVLAVGVTGVALFDFILRTLRGYFLDIAGKKADVLMASLLFQQVTGLRLSHQPSSTGAMAKHLNEFESLRDFFTSATLTALVDLPFVLLFLLFIQLIGGALVWTPLLMVPLVLLIGLLLQRPMARAIHDSAKEAAQKHAILVETLNGLETIKILGAEGAVQGKWEQCVGLTAQSSLTSRFYASLATHSALLAQQLATVGVVLHGVYLIHDGTLTTGALFACSLLAGRALAPLAQVATLLVRLQQSMVSLKTLDGIMALPLERPPGEPFLRRPDPKGAIEFQNVTFRYPGQSTPTLANFSLRITPGERVGFIGRVGSGKSTLFKLLLGLYQPDSGSILLDGADARQVDPVDIRRAMGSVPQETQLFFGTLRENITFGAPFAYEADILKAARCAGVEEFVNRHPRGFDQMIGEQGRGLSGGQRQAVVIARALLGDPPILLLDEPTSAMDNSSETRFKERLMQELTGRTLLLVTHRASLLTMVDRIIILEDGRVVADGPKEVILRQLSDGQLRSPQEGAP